MDLNFQINLTSSQKEALELINNFNYKYYVFNWSRQSGKSTLMKIICIIWLFNTKKNIGYICKNYILAKKLYKDILALIPKEFIVSSNGTDLTVTTTFLSTLTFYSAESGSSLRGQTFDYLICDEFAFFKFEQTDGSHLWFDVLFPTVKVKGKKIIFVSTPLGKNNLFYEMFKKGITPENPAYISMKKNIYSDGLITDDEIEEIKKQIPEISFRQEFLCEFLDSSNSFFQNYDNCFIKNLNFNNSKKIWIGIDLSGNGTDETILTKINEKNEVIQFKIEGSLDEKYKQISNLINNETKLIAVYIENNGLGAPMINEIKKLCKYNFNKIFEFHTTNTSKEEIISNLAVKLANNDIFFEENNSELFDQFNNFMVTVSKSKRYTFNGKNGTKDDRVMSLAIALECKSNIKGEPSKPIIMINKFKPVR